MYCLSEERLGQVPGQDDEREEVPHESYDGNDGYQHSVEPESEECSFITSRRPVKFRDIQREIFRVKG